MTTAFVSYSWDSPVHKDWVRRFADDLMRNAVETILDQYDLGIGDDRFQFMEASMRDAEYVLCICTPRYVQRANEREGGVGVEASLITPRLFENNHDKKFIPVIRETENGVCPTPDYMSSLVYIDFTNDDEYQTRLEELLRHMHQEPKYRKPALGQKPDFTDWDPPEIERLKSILRRSARSFDFLRDTASFSYTDDQFNEIIEDHPSVFAQCRIIKRENGKRIIPGRPGIRLR